MRVALRYYTDSHEGYLHHHMIVIWIDFHYYTDSHVGWLTLLCWQSCGLTYIIILIVMWV